MTPSTRRLRLVREIKGAALYQEIDANGADVTTSNPDAMIGTLRVRKKFFDSSVPMLIDVTIVSAKARAPLNH